MMITMSVLNALLTKLLITAITVTIYRARMKTASLHIFTTGVSLSMHGHVEWNDGHAKSGDEVTSVADWAEEFTKRSECSWSKERRSGRLQGFDPFLLLQQAQNIFNLRINRS